jgi:ubiquinone biosynthesis protein COQ4
MAKSPRIRPLDAWRALRALLRNPDETKHVFELIDALSGGSGERLFRRFRATESGARILAERRQLLRTLADREALLALPPGSLGRSYAEFMGREQISPEGLVQASLEGGRGPADLKRTPDRELVGNRMRDQHDLWHVVTGYGRDLIGEAAVLAFTYAQTRNRGIGAIVAMAWWKAGSAAPWVRPFLRDAYRRGKRAAWLPAQDWEALLARPLGEVRAELGVGEPRSYQELRSAGAAAVAA